MLESFTRRTYIALTLIPASSAHLTISYLQKFGASIDPNKALYVLLQKTHLGKC